MTTSSIPTSAYGWFEALEPGRQDVLREDRWALAEAAWTAARSFPPSVENEMVERAAIRIHSESGEDTSWSTISSDPSHVLTADRYRSVARRILEAAFDHGGTVHSSPPWLPDGEAVTTRHVSDLVDGIRSGQAEEETILRLLDRLLEPRAVTVPTPTEQALRTRVSDLEKDVERLRRLDAEYGRLESRLIMLDPCFDGDDEGECIDRLLDSVDRLAARAHGRRSRPEIGEIDEAGLRSFEGVVLGRHGDEGSFGAELLGSVRIESPAELAALRVPFVRRHHDGAPSPDAPGTRVVGRLSLDDGGVRIVGLRVAGTLPDAP